MATESSFFPLLLTEETDTDAGTTSGSVRVVNMLEELASR